MKNVSLIILFSLSLLLGACSSDTLSKSESPKIKNIIFLIGDGMGTSQVYAAMLASEDSLNMEKAETAGFSTTNSLNQKITDSAAAGTALATGKKTRNGILAQDTTGNNFVSILKVAEQNGLSTGLVATATITHATPASFVANQPSRNMYEAIAADFMKTDIEVFIGGGYNHFARRSDSLNYVDSLLAKDYTVVRTLEELKTTEASKIAGLLYDEHPPRMSEGRGDMLPVATRKALDVLSTNEKGFFLMVEGSQIDWGGHGNDADYVVKETLDFDKAIGVALKFREQHPNTLVVVTADHETGGLSLPSPDGDYHKSEPAFSTGGHTSVMVPVFAWGPGAEEFTGIFDNTEFFTKFLELYSFEK